MQRTDKPEPAAAAKARLVSAICVLLAGSASLVLAEDPFVPGVGSRIRIHSLAPESAPLVGTLAAADEKSLTVGVQGNRVPTVVALADVSRLERSVGPSRKGKGALIGLGVGFGLGLAGTFVLCELYGSSCPTGEGFVYGSIYGAAAGAVGAGLGALVAPGERWADVPTDAIRLGQGRKQSSGGVQLTILPMVGRRRGLTIVASFR